MSGKGEIAKEKRADGLRRLANRLGCPVTLLDKSLISFIGPGRTIPVTRVYGKKWAELAKSLI